MPTLISRLLGGVVTLVGVVIVTFFIVNLIPSDPAAVLAGPGASSEFIAELRTKLGLDQPLLVRLAHYFGRLIQGDLGVSFYTDRPVIHDLLARLPATLELSLAALLLGLGVGIPVGVYSALHRNSILDHAVRAVTVSGFAIASFWLAIMLQLFFVMRLDLLPLSGRIAGNAPPFFTGFYTIDSLIAGDWRGFTSALMHLVLPAFTQSVPLTATIVRFMRASVLDNVGRPSVQYAQAMGLPPSLITWKYVVRSALKPVITQVGLVCGAILGGSVVVESIFDWPGLGFYAFNSIIMSDYNAVIAFTIWISTIYVLLNILVDFGHKLVDPRELR
ncbi:MAG: ABC transporter permease [Hyphomicrobiaceae bacterium]|uniref:ABC transporter permease n=1 Tax=Pseudorhodoplanes sp. TaxID=1934341 RepID=UPI003D0BAF10